jgi:phospholipid/cholesterol/gamma-HCH transport system substrate-binding protein
MKKASIETAVGLFVLIGILCVGYLTVKLGKMEILGRDYYSVNAQFDSVTGLKVGANVEMAGVPIGKVEAIALDSERQVARVRLKIQSSVVSYRRHHRIGQNRRDDRRQVYQTEPGGL